MMKPCQTSSKESIQEKGEKRKRNKGGKDQSPSKQTAPKRDEPHKEAREPLSTETSTSHLKHFLSMPIA
jgi:hypothetical protein